MALDLYLAYVFACILIAIIPGPTVTVIIANSNVAGTQLGLALMMLTLVVGLSSVIAAMGSLFERPLPRQRRREGFSCRASS